MSPAANVKDAGKRSYLRIPLVAIGLKVTVKAREVLKGNRRASARVIAIEKHRPSRWPASHDPHERLRAVGSAQLLYDLHAGLVHLNDRSGPYFIQEKLYQWITLKRCLNGPQLQESPRGSSIPFRANCFSCR
jgi:hypothetical protein